MILDERTEFLDATALNLGAPGSFLLGDVIDLTNVRDIGMGEPLWLVVTVDTTATSGGAATLALNLLTDGDPALGSPVVLATSPTLALAALVAGAMIWAVALPIEGNLYERYLGIQQVTGAAAFTAGKINANIVRDVAKRKLYPDAVN
jgi:hypothetical protein